MRRIHGEAERRVFVGDGALDMIVDPRFVAAHVKLENAQRVRCQLGDCFKTRIAHRAQHMSDAEFAGRLDYRIGAFGMETFQRSDRAQHERQAQLAAEDLRGGIDLAHVAQYARPERDRIERHAVAAQRGLGLDTAGDVIPGVLVQIGAGSGDHFVQVEIGEIIRGIAQERGFVLDLLVHGGGTLC